MTHAPQSLEPVTMRQDDFLDVVLADPDLLAAEFAAIVAANWGAAPPDPPRVPRRPSYGGGRRVGTVQDVPVRVLAVPRRLPARQRSPPDRDGRGPAR